MKLNQFYGFKIDQSQTFDSKGRRLVVTRLETKPLVIKQIKSVKKDKYNSYQVAIGLKNKKAGKKLREIRLEQEPDLKTETEIKITDIFQLGDLVQVKGITKGRGFTGVVKRWGFKGGPRTHGQSDRERAPGSIGQGTNPGRVWKGKKMPGHMGNKAKTIKGLKVFKIDEEKNELWLSGLVPGKKGSLIKISKLT